jgi:hypothetical protein
MTSRGRRVHHVNVNAALTALRGFVASTPPLIVALSSATLVLLSFIGEDCCRITMPADIRSFFGGGPPKASQGSEGSAKKDEVCLPSRYN